MVGVLYLYFHLFLCVTQYNSLTRKVPIEDRQNVLIEILEIFEERRLSVHHTRVCSFNSPIESNQKVIVIDVLKLAIRKVQSPMLNINGRSTPCKLLSHWINSDHHVLIDILHLANSRWKCAKLRANVFVRIFHPNTVHLPNTILDEVLDQLLEKLNREVVEGSPTHGVQRGNSVEPSLKKRLHGG